MARILVVDDEIDLTEAIARGLRRQGYAVDIANNKTDKVIILSPKLNIHSKPFPNANEVKRLPLNRVIPLKLSLDIAVLNSSIDEAVILAKYSVCFHAPVERITRPVRVQIIIVSI